MASRSARIALLLASLSLSPGSTQTGFRFEDVTASAGIRFRAENGVTPEKFIIETMGSGVGFLDYDSDGRLDLVFVSGGGRPGSAASKTDRLTLYRNLGDGKFEDVTARAGLAGAFDTYGMGVAAADYDNDGRPDLLLTGYPHCVLFHNDGNGRFSDVTSRAGVANEGRLATSAGWFDYDRDGRLDLVIADYVADFSWDRPIYCGEKKPGFRAYCHPDVYRGTSPRLYHNEGGGRFRDVTAEAKILASDGKCLGVALADFDGDGWPDIFIANDSVRNFLYRNRHDGTFEETGVPAGVGFSEDGKAEAGMGVDAADLYVTHLDFELSRLYRNNGGSSFADVTRAAGLGRVTYFYSGFGVKIADFDNSGRRHILVANGHILDNIQLYKSEVTYAEPLVLLENDGAGKFRNTDLFTAKLVGRGLAVGDFDNDGLLDVAVSQNFGPPLLLKNRSRSGHWITLQLRGGSRSNRDAIGATVILTSGGKKQAGEVVGGTSYCSAHDYRLHFGLGPADRVDEVRIRWPSGNEETRRNLAVDQFVTIAEQ